jgi:hypothetical protein
MRRTIVVLVTAALAMTLYFANVAWWLETEVLDSDAFVATTLEAMEDDATRDAAAAIIVDRLSDEFPLLRLLDSALTGLFSDLLGRDVIQPLIVATSTDVHRRIIEGDQSALVIDLDPYRPLLLAPLESLSSELAARVPDDWFRTVDVFDQGALPDLSAYARNTERAAIVTSLLSVVLMAILFVASKRWFSAFAAVGAAFILAGGFSALLVPGARSTAAILVEDEPSSVLLIAVFNAFTHPLTTRSFSIVGVGAVFLFAGLLGWLVNRSRSPRLA